MTNGLSPMHTAARYCALTFALIAAVAPRWTAGADETTASISAANAASSLSARDRLYTELAADVAEFEQRGSILKRVVKLATPTVVHIEAKRESEGSRSTRGDSEETGSGVIIQRGSKLFVLTNR